MTYREEVMQKLWESYEERHGGDCQVDDRELVWRRGFDDAVRHLQTRIYQLDQDTICDTEIINQINTELEKLAHDD